MDINNRDIEVSCSFLSMHVVELTDEHVIISDKCPRCNKDEEHHMDANEGLRIVMTFDPEDEDDLQLRQVFRTLTSIDEHANISVELALSVVGLVVKCTSEVS